jgi:hypothetical protein
MINECGAVGRVRIEVLGGNPVQCCTVHNTSHITWFDAEVGSRRLTPWAVALSGICSFHASYAVVSGPALWNICSPLSFFFLEKIRVGLLNHIVQGSAPSKTEDETTNNRLRVLHVGTLTTLGRTFGRTNRRKMMVVNLDQLASYEGTARDQRS